MPIRVVNFQVGAYYHIFNKCIPELRLFPDDRAYRHFRYTCWYYSLNKPPLSLSRYLDKSHEARQELRKDWDTKQVRVKILAYCFMSNHFHLLLKQNSEGGIGDYLYLLQNSYAHYLNTRNHRLGALFSGRYKAVQIESEVQLLHVSRYIHLNPVTAYIVKKISDLSAYPWSSWNEYAGLLGDFPICNDLEIMRFFNGFKSYRDFCHAAVDYERELKSMQKMMLDEADGHKAVAPGATRL